MDSSGFDELANGAGKILKAVPQLYEDAIQPSVKASGKTVELIPRAINAALEPLHKWIIQKEHNIEKTKLLLAKELENVEIEKIVSPEPYIAVPALQALSYCMDSDKLRPLFAKLLARSMNVDKKDTAHPSFIEVIKQLSPFDAEMISVFKRAKMIPSANYVVKNNVTVDIISNVILGVNSCMDVMKISTSMTNLIRLGLLYNDLSIHSESDVYDIFMADELIQQMSQFFNNESGKTVRELVHIKKGFISTTSYGMSFIATCV